MKPNENRSPHDQCSWPEGLCGGEKTTKMPGQALQTDPVARSKVQKLANSQDQRKSSLAVSRNSHILAGQVLHRDRIQVLQFTAEVMFETFGSKLGRTKAVSVTH